MVCGYGTKNSNHSPHLEAVAPNCCGTVVLCFYTRSLRTQCAVAIVNSSRSAHFGQDTCYFRQTWTRSKP